MLNGILLTFPFLYRTPLVRYETNLDGGGGLSDLLAEVPGIANLRGDIIECGSSRCGSTVILAKELRRHGVKKTIYACDSYEGFDRAELRKEKALGWTQAPEDAFTSTSFEYVKRKVRRLGVDDIVVPVKGYFQQTLPGLTGDLAMALIDCDLKDSMAYSAEQIWPRLVSGGRLLFDDYLAENWKGARQAVDEFVAAHQGEIASHGLRTRLYGLTKK